MRLTWGQRLGVRRCLATLIEANGRRPRRTRGSPPKLALKLATARVAGAGGAGQIRDERPDQLRKAVNVHQPQRHHAGGRWTC